MCSLTHFIFRGIKYDKSIQIKEDIKKITHRKLTGITLSIFFIILFTTSGVMAQTGTSNQKETTSETIAEPTEKAPEMQAIAASDIPKISEETISQLDEIRSKIKPLNELNDIENNFDELKDEIKQLEMQLNASNLEDLKFNRLVAIQNTWENIKIPISNWQNNLQSRSQELETYGQTLNEKQQWW